MRLLVGIFLVIGFTPFCFAKCHIPPYKIARDVSNSTLGVGSLNVSLRAEDFTIFNLACLSTSLRSKHEDWNTFSIRFFTSRDAAKNFVTPGIEEAPRITERARQLNATYSFDANAHQEYIDILPFGFETNREYATQINLPVATSQCRLEMNNRCLIALQQVEYPPAALKANAQGSVTLSGTISRKGKITDIRVTKNTVRPEEQAHLFSDAAIKNLSKWQLESSIHEDAVKISYTYRIDSAYKIEFNLPDSIVVSQKP